MVVISPPLTAISPEVVISPELPVIEKLVAVTSLAPKERALTISVSERSKALVMVPASDCILMPVDRASSRSKFSTSKSWDGGEVLAPSVKDK